MSKKKSSKIKLNETNNKNRIYTLLFIIFIASLFIFSKSYLPDGRPNTTNFNQEHLISLPQVKIGIDSFSYNSELELGEFRFTENISNKDDKYKIEYTLYDSNNEEISFNIIESELLQVEGQQYQRYIIIQYALPKNYYNVSVRLEQINVQHTTIRLDYRDNPESEILEKGKDFLLVNQDLIFNYKNYFGGDLEEKIQISQSIIDYTQNQIDSTTDEDELKILEEDKAKEEKVLEELNEQKDLNDESFKKLEREYIDYLSK